MCASFQSRPLMSFSHGMYRLLVSVWGCQMQKWFSSSLIVLCVLWSGFDLFCFLWGDGGCSLHVVFIAHTPCSGVCPGRSRKVILQVMIIFQDLARWGLSCKTIATSWKITRWNFFLIWLLSEKILSLISDRSFRLSF